MFASPTGMLCLTHMILVFSCSQSTPKQGQLYPHLQFLLWQLIPISNVADWHHTYWCRLMMLPSQLRICCLYGAALLHPDISAAAVNLYTASTAVAIYATSTALDIHTASTAVEYICCIYFHEYTCCIHCCGTNMLYPRLWSIYAAPTAVDYVSLPLLWSAYNHLWCSPKSTAVDLC